MPPRRYWVSMPPSSRIERIVATATIHSSEMGMRRFQPKCMNWS